MSRKSSYWELKEEMERLQRQYEQLMNVYIKLWRKTETLKQKNLINKKQEK